MAVIPKLTSAFKKFSMYSRNAMNKSRVASGMMMNSLKGTISTNLGRGSKIGLTKAGISTGNQLREKLLGVNVGLVDNNFRPLVRGAGHTSNRLGATIGKKLWSMTGRNYAAQAAVGATAMASISIMNGGMSQANDIMMERYMRDARYSSRLLSKASLGKSTGNSPLNLGNTTGLSLALSKTRHGH